MPEKILVVDDEESLAEMVCRALKQQGYKTVAAYDGDAALDLISEELPDLVILDLMLPKMDGWEVCRRAKSDQQTKEIPIMMLTARSSSEDVVQGLDLGADDYLKKPFKLEELLARVRALLDAEVPRRRFLPNAVLLKSAKRRGRQRCAGKSLTSAPRNLTSLTCWRGVSATWCRATNF